MIRLAGTKYVGESEIIEHFVGKRLEKVEVKRADDGRVYDAILRFEGDLGLLIFQREGEVLLMLARND